MYLEAIANNPNDVGDINQSPHGRFWNVPYKQFVTGTVPGGQQVECNNNPTPIINSGNPSQSPLFLILTDPNGFCGMPQMPEGGPFITDANYQVTLSDGTTVTGAQIQQDMLNWLTNGFPQ
jgi:hypothetical protein